MSEHSQPASADEAADDTNESDGFTTRLRRAWRGRRFRLIALAVLLAAVGFVCWLGVDGHSAKSDLERARAEAQHAKEALTTGDVEAAVRFASSAEADAKNANDAVRSVPWTAAAHVPWLGRPFRSAQQITQVILGLTSDVLKPAAELGTALSPTHLIKGSHVDVQTLREKAPGLVKIATDAKRLEEDASAISDPTYVSALRDARSELQAQTNKVSDLLQTASLTAKLAPALMGVDGPRTYFMGFQTNAEARGTGGILGGFGILHFDNGVPTVNALGPNTELTGPFKPLDLGPEFSQEYGYTNPSTDWRNSNLSSHFPYTAQIWRSMWAQQSGQEVDGVIALDPVALSYVLGATGPITMEDGEVISQGNVVELTESTAYLRFPTDQIARKKYLQVIANAVVKKMTGAVESPRRLLDALGKAVSERRIAMWSASPEEQKLLEETPLAHTIPDDATPYAAVIINNLAGNKVDYYLRQDVTYKAEGCAGATRNTTVTVKLQSVVPDTPLPDYVAGFAGLKLNRNVPITLPTGSMLTSVRLVATKGAALVGAFSNGQQIPVFTGTDRGHPTFEVQVAIPPRQLGELTFRLSEPTVPGAAQVPAQPLIAATAPTIDVPACSQK
ncbi:DUF4012 domain-containing protein [Mycolicibacterium sp. CBMA 226]|uniref:DUF4012 domain-containing protein n=1 Tax=Mycolicibacterium sp. CBMA 226 TaxID=2606611 RepID=UPI0013056FD3|nr:DUF4012 domain-containing protein [Mycolicibacterium sp. CBMA 226]MUL76172.1 DUF4012 domain-containing protein [Mycolicibacterium sp. CBMA 226]